MLNIEGAIDHSCLIFIFSIVNLFKSLVVAKKNITYFYYAISSYYMWRWCRAACSSAGTFSTVGGKDFLIKKMTQLWRL